MARSVADVGPRLRVWLDGAGARFPARRESVIPLLQAAQEEFGYLPPEAMDAIARYVRMPAAAVQGIATFYAQFRFCPPGRHKVTICRGTACHVRGSGALLEDIQAWLDVAPQETTADGAFTLETVACFGSCALAPVVVVDGKVQGRQTATTAKRMLSQVRRGDGRPARGSRRRRAT